MRRFLAVFFVAVAANAQPQLALKQIASGLNRPVGIANAGDSRLFIILQAGQIVIYDGSGILPTPFLDIRQLVTPGISGQSERGLLGLAFDPRRNGFFFVHYTNTSGDITIARYQISSDPDRADPNSGTIVLTIPHPNFSNHNGGQLQFGPDGFLYDGVGDGGSAGDPNDNAQNTSRLLGKILRIDVSTLPYRIPSSNPFGNEIWAYGLRNPWRFSFDRITGDLWIGDVGQNSFEEVDLQPATSIGGVNYGWRRMEGFHCFNPSTNCGDPSFTPPILEYSHSGGACSITGGYRYRGARYPRMSGIYFYGDYCTGAIFGATQQSNGTWTSQTLLSTRLAISSFGEDQNGELYVADLSGSVSQITDSLAAQPRRRAVKK
ncbi:MAG TPA: PQQ-dependent sugar dehydrogenase [Thermoanaerobaculia bacterium]|nr:PQQ-dependent sugar dehydrogenase [Thermoanaerobaculia bacterium]